MSLGNGLKSELEHWSGWKPTLALNWSLGRQGYRDPLQFVMHLSAQGTSLPTGVHCIDVLGGKCEELREETMAQVREALSRVRMHQLSKPMRVVSDRGHLFTESGVYLLEPVSDKIIMQVGNLFR